MMLTLICGIPNAGKTTYSAKYANVIHLDDMPKDEFKNCCIKAREAKGDVCVEGLYHRKKYRQELIDMCRHQSPKICIWLDTPLQECVKREINYRQRPLGIVTIHNELFEPPTLDEGWDEIITVKN